MNRVAPMVKPKNILVTLFLVFLSAPIFGFSLPYKLELSSHFPGIQMFHTNGPHIYKVSAHYHKELLPYIYYTQDNKHFELGFGSLLDHSFKDNSYTKAFFSSGLYFKTTFDPISAKYYILPSNQYISLALYKDFGVSILAEEYENIKSPTITNQKNTITLFGKVKNELGFLSGALHLASYQGVLDNSGVGVNIKGGVSFEFQGISNTFSISKINWKWDKDYSFTYQPKEFYFMPYYKTISSLRNLEIDTISLSYEGSVKVEKIKLLWEMRKLDFDNSFLLALGSHYQHDKHIGFISKVYKDSKLPGISVLFNLVIVHFMGG
jgi:hypothetical protein